MRSNLVRLAAAAALPVLCLAVSTKTWIVSTYADFDKGELKGVSLRSDGRITLAPRTAEVFDSSLAYLWALARDSKGVLYAGGGPGARVYRFDPTKPGSKPEKAAEFDAIEVHALAIDKQDRVYAATFPDGRIYRLIPGAKPEEFYNPKCKYIWTMLFDASGNLFVATGDHGEIHRVGPDGKGSIFFRGDDTHVRSLAFRGADLIAGTDPTGLVIRITPQGTGFVLYQLPKREVTAVAAAPDGSIYAAGAGTQAAPGEAGALVNAMAAARQAAAASASLPAAPERPAPEAAAPNLPRVPALSGGSEVYRIDPSGLPEKIWSHPRDVVYAIAFDRNGLPILGAGNKGTLYRVDSPSLYTALSTVNADQITALLTGADGGFIAATANVGKVYRFGPELAKEGTFTSDVFDSGAFSTWGMLKPWGDSASGEVLMESHSGNLDRPRQYWSAWSTTAPPPSRFVQWRATLRSADGVSPVLDSVEQAYLSRNIAPRIEEIESTPPNYKFPAPPLAQTLLQRLPANLNLPPMGHHAASNTPLSPDADSSVVTFAKGWIGVRWSASDENADPLTYTLQIRGAHEADWKPLKDKIAERHYSFDSTAFPDGEYRIRVIASDQPGNPAGEALTGQLESSPILIDNTPPVISALVAKPAAGAVRVTWKAADALNVIRRAEYSLDGDDWTLVDPVTRLSDAQTLEYALPLSGLTPGEHTIAVRVTDDYDNTSVEKVVIR
jgi:hypothetical protein